jgi:hypothetical protein
LAAEAITVAAWDIGRRRIALLALPVKAAFTLEGTARATVKPYGFQS